MPMQCADPETTSKISTYKMLPLGGCGPCGFQKSVVANGWIAVASTACARAGHAHTNVCMHMCHFFFFTTSSPSARQQTFSAPSQSSRVLDLIDVYAPIAANLL